MAPASAARLRRRAGTDPISSTSASTSRTLRDFRLSSIAHSTSATRRASTMTSIPGSSPMRSRPAACGRPISRAARSVAHQRMRSRGALRGGSGSSRSIASLSAKPSAALQSPMPGPGLISWMPPGSSPRGPSAMSISAAPSRQGVVASAGAAVIAGRSASWSSRKRVGAAAEQPALSIAWMRDCRSPMISRRQARIARPLQMADQVADLSAGTARGSSPFRLGQCPEPASVGRDGGSGFGREIPWREGRGDGGTTSVTETLSQQLGRQNSGVGSAFGPASGSIVVLVSFLIQSSPRVNRKVNIKRTNAVKSRTPPNHQAPGALRKAYEMLNISTCSWSRRRQPEMRLAKQVWLRCSNTCSLL